MMKHRCIEFMFVLSLLFSFTACGSSGDKQTFEEKLSTEIPLLGHRNWIVITDMAYPLQNRPGIETVYADESFKDVVKTVFKKIKKAPHVYAHVYQDEEVKALTEEICPGIEKYRKSLEESVPAEEVKFMRHEKLLSKMEGVSRSYKVLVIKTDLTLPYTSLFIELDCKYWDADKQKLLEEMLRQKK